MVREIKNAVVKTVNGHKKTAVAGVLGLLGAGWVVNAQRHIEDVPVLRAEFDKHMVDVPTLTKTVVDRAHAESEAIRERVDLKADALERQMVIQTEADGEYRKLKLSIDESNHRVVMDALKELRNDVKDRLPAKP